MNSVSLFSGCLGLDLGLEQAGIRTRVTVESDSVCRQTIYSNRPAVVQFEDIRSVKGSSIRRHLRNVDILVGGPPCQSFSTIGSRGLLEDVRGGLVFEYLRLLRELKPRFLVMENVIGILSAKKGKRPLVDWVKDQLSDLGYDSQAWKLNALDYGAPQKRLRVILVGSRCGTIPMLTPHVGMTTLGEAIKDLETMPGECGRFSPRFAAVMAKVPEGGDWRSLPSAWRKKAMGNANLKSGGLTAFYRRVSYDRPSPTLVTSPTQRATTLCHPRVTRPLSVLEYKRVQGFPDDYVLVGSTTQKYRQLGNAVPLPLGKAIGEAIMKVTGA